MNLLCGVIGVICAFEGRLDLSFMFMLAAALCDFCDGLCARMLNAFSPIGKELDSLADLVSFGLLPALMFHELAREALEICGRRDLIGYGPKALIPPTPPGQKRKRLSKRELSGKIGRGREETGNEKRKNKKR